MKPTNDIVCTTGDTSKLTIHEKSSKQWDLPSENDGGFLYFLPKRNVVAKCWNSSSINYNKIYCNRVSFLKNKEYN